MLEKTESSNSILSNMSEPCLGILGKEFSPEKQDYDPDDDFAYDERSGSYQQFLDLTPEAPFTKLTSANFWTAFQNSNETSIGKAEQCIANYISGFSTQYSFAALKETFSYKQTKVLNEATTFVVELSAVELS